MKMTTKQRMMVSGAVIGYSMAISEGIKELAGVANTVGELYLLAKMTTLVEEKLKNFINAATEEGG